MGAFDWGRLSGTKPPLSRAYAFVPWQLIDNLPQKTGLGCKSIGITPVDYARGVENRIPAGFNPRPGTDPTEPKAKAINTRAEVSRAKDPDD